MKMQGWGSGARFFFVVRRIGIAIMSGWQCCLGATTSTMSIGKGDVQAMISLPDTIRYVLQAIGDHDALQTYETFLKTHHVLEAMKVLLDSFNWMLDSDMQGAVQGWKIALQYLVHGDASRIGSFRDVIIDNPTTRALLLNSTVVEILAKWEQLK
jgi:hypothetical protein